jgi:hypothetical protein
MQYGIPSWDHPGKEFTGPVTTDQAKTSSARIRYSEAQFSHRDLGRDRQSQHVFAEMG